MDPNPDKEVLDSSFAKRLTYGPLELGSYGLRARRNTAFHAANEAVGA
jgi:hypothetical protein